MRIIAGSLKGAKLVSPKTDARPTQELVRKALFDIIGCSIEGKTFLDMFAGSGAVGMEAISRGASKAILIEKDQKAIQCIQKNITALQIKDKASLIKGDTLRMISLLIKKNISFDYIFIDPPYGLTHQGKLVTLHLLEEISNTSLLNPSSEIFIEDDKKSQKVYMDIEINNLNLSLYKRYGSTYLYKAKKTIPKK